MKHFANGFFDKFHIGTYCLQENARTEATVKDMRDCGIDLLFGIDNDEALLDLLYRHGIGAVVSGIVPHWFGGNGDNAGKMELLCTDESYINGISGFADHPATVGIDICDEPSSIDLHRCGQAAELVNKLLPSKFPYINLYPSYGMTASNDSAQRKKELGVANYKDYLEEYCKNVDLPYLSLDHYPFSSSTRLFFSDLEAAAEVCKKNGKRLLTVLQVNSHEKDVYLSKSQLCFQAFIAMAYGASAITWACYSAGWWYNNVLDENGEKTEQYFKLKDVNHAILALSKEYCKYSQSSTSIIKGGTSCKRGDFTNIVATNDMILGEFEKKSGNKAIFISLADPNASDCTLSFRLDGKGTAHLFMPNGEKVLTCDADGVYRITFSNTEACFVTVE
ncbi:MAG: hypothetical protein IKA51_02240 [Clostridia bacterium]|nr:hypothetical protein [Clostridia bacterium]